MRLADFIIANMESIVAEWESFARLCSPRAERMTSLALQDHAEEVLRAISLDLCTPQTAQAELLKSTGQSPVIFGAPETAAQTHAVLRAKDGFDVNQLVSEYRALRGSVLRLWINDCEKSEINYVDLMRFNEAIDQAVAESIQFFEMYLSQSRNLLLGMLGHDMRTPLWSIILTAEYLSQLNAGQEVSEAACILIRSGKAVQELLDDLVDFNRTHLGVGINVSPARVDLGSLFLNEAEILRSAHPSSVLDLHLEDHVVGFWDGHRLTQLLRNLVVNAIKYGLPGAPIRIALTSDSSTVTIEVTNQGAAIEQSVLDGLFEPLSRASQHASSWSDTSMGLGLFIAREIVLAHHGSIHATSVNEKTSFTVCLPRNGSQSERGSLAVATRLTD